MRRFLCALMALSALGQMARAQEFPPVFVYGEDDTDFERACALSYGSAIAAVVSEFRKNNVALTKSSEQYREGSVMAYLNINPVETSSNACAVAYSMRIYHYQDIYNTLTNRSEVAAIDFCSKGGVMNGVRYNLQTRLNDAFRDYTNQCISQALGF